MDWYNQIFELQILDSAIGLGLEENITPRKFFKNNKRRLSDKRSPLKICQKEGTYSNIKLTKIKYFELHTCVKNQTWKYSCPWKKVKFNERRPFNKAVALGKK